jgi:hypothetical protein
MRATWALRLDGRRRCPEKLPDDRREARRTNQSRHKGLDMRDYCPMPSFSSRSILIAAAGLMLPLWKAIEW